MVKKVYERFKNNFSLTFQFGSFLIFIIFLVYLLCLLLFTFLPITNIFSMFLFILILSLVIGFITPSIYAFFISNDFMYNQNGIEVNFKFFLANRRAGKHPIIKSQLRIFNYLLNAILIYIGLSLIGFGIVILVESGFDIKDGLFGFINESQSLNSITDSQVLLEKLNELLLKYESGIERSSVMIGIFSSFLPIYYFIHSILISLMRYYIINSFPSGQVNYRVYKLTLKNPEVKHYQGYYKILWPYLIAFIMIFYGVYLSFYFAFNVSNLLILISSALMISLFVLIPFFPLVLNYNFFMRQKFLSEYFKKYKEQYLKEVEINQQYQQFLKENKRTEEDFRNNLDQVINVLNENKDKDENQKEEDKGNKNE